MRKDIIKSSNELFEIGSIYDRKTIIEMFKKNKTSIINITAYTYNRWNKGMLEIIEIFEYLSRDQYKYIGPKNVSNYSGPVFHNPKGKSHEYKIGNWDKGVFKFLNNDLLNFRDWLNSDYDGILVIIENSKITFRSIDVKIIQNKILTNKESNVGMMEGEYSYIHINSKLGQILFNKCLDDEFVFGNIKYKITNIIN